MTDDRTEAGSRRRHPSNRERRPQGTTPRSPLRAVHSDSHNCESSPTPAPTPAPTRPLTGWHAVAVAELAGGVVAGVWVDWRWLVTGAAAFLVTAVIGGQR